MNVDWDEDLEPRINNLDHCESKQVKGETWVKINPVMDSGIADTICLPGYIARGDRRETEASKAGVGYTAADGGKMRNTGEGPVKGFSEDGIGVKMVSQEGDKVKRMLISVDRTTDEGNAVVFIVDRELLRRLAQQPDLLENAIVNKKTFNKSRIQKNKGLYTYPMWIKKPKKSLGSAQNLEEGEPEDDGFGPF